MNTPKINVTPLIDVLLVLLIIFMVVAPLRPNSFRAKVPSEPDPRTSAVPDSRTIVVSIGRDLSISLNNERSLGTVDDPDALITRLKSVFTQREENGMIDEHGNVVKIVFLKAPKNIGYGSVVKVIDAVKEAGGDPLALQIDYLD
ncbi:MAG TPA: biopolymer transporter ExbD [Pyrinomonadaceae bacterium]